MSSRVARLRLFFRRLLCRIFGHVKADMSIRTVGIRVCRRCLRITDQKTVRARVTRGEIEERMTAHLPEGYRFVSMNWKKRKAKFVTANGRQSFILL